MGKIELDIKKYQTGSSDQVFDRFISNPENKITKNVKGEYIRGNTKLHWEDVKADASGLSHARRRTVIENDSGKQFLLDFGSFRNLYVNTLLAEVASSLGCVRKCVALAVGSVNPTSDYDITLTGPKSNKIVEEFNDRFREKWGVESGVIFDTNLYGASFLIPQSVPNFDYFLKKDMKEIAKRQTLPEKLVAPSDFVFYVNMNEDPKDIRWQRFWAWNKFQFWKAQVFRKSDPKRSPFLNLSSGIIFPTFKTDFELSQSMFNELTRSIDVNDLSAMNSQYEKELNKLSKMRLEFDIADSIEEVKQKGRELKNQISRANFYGNETYLTQGAFNHVVGKMQSGFINLPIERHEYVDSFIENSSELVKEYSIHLNDVNADRTVTESSKYMIRASQAALELIDMGLFDGSEMKTSAKKKMEEAFKLSQTIRSFRSTGNKFSHEKQLEIIDKFYNLIGIITLGSGGGGGHKRSRSLAGAEQPRRSFLSAISPFRRASTDTDLDPVAISRPAPSTFIQSYLETLFIPFINQIYRQGFPFASEYQPVNPVNKQPIQTVASQPVGDLDPIEEITEPLSSRTQSPEFVDEEEPMIYLPGEVQDVMSGIIPQ